jgi:hypothetical protein
VLRSAVRSRLAPPNKKGHPLRVAFFIWQIRGSNRRRRYDEAQDVQMPRRPWMAESGRAWLHHFKNRGHAVFLWLRRRDPRPLASMLGAFAASQAMLALFAAHPRLAPPNKKGHPTRVAFFIWQIRGSNRRRRYDEAQDVQMPRRPRMAESGRAWLHQSKNRGHAVFLWLRRRDLQLLACMLGAFDMPADITWAQSE